MDLAVGTGHIPQTLDQRAFLLGREVTVDPVDVLMQGDMGLGRLLGDLDQVVEIVLVNIPLLSQNPLDPGQLQVFQPMIGLRNLDQ
jgi:hypothetical protein